MEADLGPVNWSSSAHHVLLNPRWPAADVANLRERARLLLRERAVGPSLVLASSGTGAENLQGVKLAVLSKSALLASARAVNARFGFSRADVFGGTLPEFHVGGLGLSARAFAAGAAFADLRGDGTWSARNFHAHASAAKITVTSLVPTQLHDLMEIGLKPWPGLRCVFLGGAAVAEELETVARAAGWPLVATYGMTETSSMIAVRGEPGAAHGFEILPHVEVEIREGRVAVRSGALATSVADSEGWFVTEDRGEISGGRLYVRGRDRDHVKVNGENVDLAALRTVFDREAANHGLSSVDFHLGARPDARRGSAIALFVREGCDFTQALAAFDGKVLPFERVHEIVVVPEIPRTELGKVREAALAALVRKG